MIKRPQALDVLEFGRQVWEAWSQKNLDIWKLSHGNPPNFTDAERQHYLDELLAVMHRDTGKEQGQDLGQPLQDLLHRRSGGRQAHAPSRACAASSRFTRWRIHLELGCIKPVRAQPPGHPATTATGGNAHDARVARLQSLDELTAQAQELKRGYE